MNGCEGRISLKPGCNALQSLESEVNGILGTPTYPLCVELLLQ